MRVIPIRPVIARRVHDARASPDDEAMARPLKALDRRLRLGREVRHRAHRHLAVELSCQTAHGGPRHRADASILEVVVRELELIFSVGIGAAGQRENETQSKRAHRAGS